MVKFPVDARLEQVIRAFNRLGFVELRRGNHIVMARLNADGTSTPLIVPNHRIIKSATLRMILTQVDVERDEFLNAFNE